MLIFRADMIGLPMAHNSQPSHPVLASDLGPADQLDGKRLGVRA